MRRTSFLIACFMLLTACYTEQVVSQPEATASAIETGIPIPRIPATTIPTPTPDPSAASIVYECSTHEVLFDSVRSDSTLPMVACADRSYVRDATQQEAIPTHTSQSETMAASITDDGTTLRITNLAGETVATFYDDSDRHILYPTWSPDGRYIALLRESLDHDAQFEVEIIHPSSRTISTNAVPPDDYSNLPFFDPGWTYLQWSPTEYQIVLSGGKPIHIAEIICSNSDNTCAGTFVGVAAKFSRDALPKWSPDGRAIAYECYSTTSEGEITHDALCIIDLSGVIENEFPETPLGIEVIDELAWSPDGDQIAMAAKPIGSLYSDIFILTLETGRIQNITAAIAGDQYNPRWLP